MPKKLWKDTKFKKVVQKFHSEHRHEIIDIILFGSSVRGKDKPNDIDILILFFEKKNLQTSYELKTSLRKAGYEAEISEKTYQELLSGTFKPAESIISEGYSIIYEKAISEGLNYHSEELFKYELRGFEKTKRMRFYYSLYGRNKNDKGMIRELKATKFSDTILLCPVENVEQMKEYLTHWQIKYTNFPILLPSRLKEIVKN